ncbi:hypothetical protein DVT68_11860 [Dyella solisilvae]|uniref:Uncharacterized protein n=1 Tax=Dyella solisilvae TaxID=1920168 RepID=A0A370K944_9GAMM|nr:hypothetical protein DVT68_11860 [Dyella solisilvae]
MSSQLIAFGLRPGSAAVGACEIGSTSHAARRDSCYGSHRPGQGASHNVAPQPTHLIHKRQAPLPLKLRAFLDFVTPRGALAACSTTPTSLLPDRRSSITLAASHMWVRHLYAGGAHGDSRLLDQEQIPQTPMLMRGRCAAML